MPERLHNCRGRRSRRSESAELSAEFSLPQDQRSPADHYGEERQFNLIERRVRKIRGAGASAGSR